jgi:nicotinate phosphoribosyltransferase
MDVDFYKFTMGQVIWKHHKGVEVVFELIVRDKHIPLAKMIPEAKLRKALDFARTLRFRPTDLYYLRGMDLYDAYMFKEDYLGFLKGYQLPAYTLTIEDNSIKLRFRGEWAEVSPWETIALAIISQLYYAAVLENIPEHELEIVYARAKDKLFRKLETLKHYSHIRFADFSQRRRHSFLWQKYVIGLCKEVMGKQFLGTSNTWMAFHYDLPPIGTNAHEPPMVLTALADSDDAKRAAQYRFTEEWEATYGQGLRIILPDTYGTDQFFRNAPELLADWRGYRQDSGNPFAKGDEYIAWLKSKGRDPREKLFIPSDGLDLPEIVQIAEYFKDRIQVSPGWGTLLGNDFRDCLTGSIDLRPFSMVCKVVEANGRPCVKLSDNIQKATGPAAEIERYKRIFGEAGRTSQDVLV